MSSNIDKGLLTVIRWHRLRILGASRGASGPGTDGIVVYLIQKERVESHRFPTEAANIDTKSRNGQPGSDGSHGDIFDRVY